MAVIKKNYWTIRNEIETIELIAACEGVSAMQIIIPLSHFVGYLNDVKQKRRTWLNETEWLMDNFRFDNENAAYDPRPEPPLDYTAWMLGHSIQVAHHPWPNAPLRIQRKLA
jgi:hypothetical protein